MHCPKCRGEMDAIDVQGVATKRCHACGGLWIEALGRERLMGAAKEAAALDTGEPALGEKMDEQTAIDCPTCHGPMIHMVDLDQPHVGFETCTICGGAFLDAGELRDLAEFTKTERFRVLWRRMIKRES